MVGSPAFGRMDLLTVVEHELGHVLGLGDLDPQAVPHELLTTTLAAGVRRLPTPSTEMSAPTPAAAPAALALPGPAASLIVSPASDAQPAGAPVLAVAADPVLLLATLDGALPSAALALADDWVSTAEPAAPTATLSLPPATDLFLAVAAVGSGGDQQDDPRDAFFAQLADQEGLVTAFVDAPSD